MLHEPVPVAFRKIGGWLHSKVHPHRHKPKQAAKKALDILWHPVLRRHWEEKYVNRHPRFAFAVMLFDLLLLFIVSALIVSGIFGYLFLPKSGAPPVVSLSLAVPTTLTSGAETEIGLTYDNAAAGPLRCAAILLLPSVRFVQTPEAVAKTTGCAAADFAGARTENLIVMPLGDILAGGKGTTVVKGRFYAPSGTSVSLNAELIYWETGKTAVSSTATRDRMTVTDSALGLTFSAEQGAVYGRPTAISFNYENRTDSVIPGVILRVEPPAGYRLLNVEPPSARPLEWRLGDLAPRARGTASATGWIFAAGKEAPAFTATAVSEAKDDTPLTLESIRANADVRTTGFELTAEIVKPTEGNPARPGDDVVIQAHYRNAGPQTIRDLRVSFLPTPAFAVSLSPAELSWDKTTVPELAVIRPGASGTLTATVTLPTDLPKDSISDSGHPEIPLRASADFYMDGDDRLVRADTIEQVIPVGTSLAIKAAGYYWTPDGEQLGVGPMPPKVGETTKYRLMLRVRNTTSPVRNVIVEATLPEGVDWTGRAAVTSGEAVDYLPSTRKLRWSVGDVPAWTDDLESQLGISVELALTPTADMIGKPADLLTGIRITGEDEATKALISGSAPDLTTLLETDLRAKDKAEVQK